jgi:hypothetical protein
VRDVSVAVDLGVATSHRLTLSVGRLQIGDERVSDLRLVCSVFELVRDAVNCRDGRLTLTSAWIALHDTPVRLEFAPAAGRIDVLLPRLPLAGGTARVALQHSGGDWRLAVSLADTRLDQLAEFAGRAGVKLPDLTLAGTVSGSVEARGGGPGVQRIDWQLQTHAAGYSNAAGSQAAEALNLESSGRATPNGPDWRLEASLAARGGMLFADPLYLEFAAARPLALDARLHWRAAAAQVVLDSLAFRQPDVVRGQASGLLAAGEGPVLKQLDVELEEARLPAFYSNWVQPWFAGSVLDELDTSGQLQGRVQVVDGQPSAVDLSLDDVSFGEPGGLFGVDALDGKLAWDASGRERHSRLAWQGAHFHQLLVGAAALALESGAEGVRLAAPLAVPLLDGELQVETFELGRDDKANMRWLLDAALTPVSMQAFTAALGWPSMAGTLSGMVPRVRYQDEELTVGGTLLVQAFDGAVTVRNLRIRQPLGLVPRLWADARLEALDLKTLTRTFSFGRIEGRLQGEVNNLYMEAWQLVAFDAHFETPPDDDSRHRISQRAVDNISNLGGAGVGGALSRGFMSVFEDFPYKRLGIRCRLANGVCHMGGVAPAETGYYLVQGRFLPPRLDVIGYAEEVDWKSLVERLVAVTRGETPRVQ